MLMILPQNGRWDRPTRSSTRSLRTAGTRGTASKPSASQMRPHLIRGTTPDLVSAAHRRECIQAQHVLVEATDERVVQIEGRAGLDTHRGLLHAAVA